MNARSRSPLENACSFLYLRHISLPADREPNAREAGKGFEAGRKSYQLKMDEEMSFWDQNRLDADDEDIFQKKLYSILRESEEYLNNYNYIWKNAHNAKQFGSRSLGQIVEFMGFRTKGACLLSFVQSEPMVEYNKFITFIASRPWYFSNPGIGLLFTSMVASIYSKIPSYAGDDERDLNPALFETMDTLSNHIFSDAKLMRPLPHGGPGSHMFFAPMTKVEQYTGADTALISHIVIGSRNYFRVTLLQEKIVKNANGTKSIEEGMPETKQLDMLASSGMGFYVFYQHANHYRKNARLLVPASVRDARRVAQEHAQTGNFSVQSISEDAIDLPAFLLSTLSDNMMIGRLFTDAEEALNTTLQQYDVDAVVGLSRSDDHSFRKLKNLTHTHTKFDKDKFKALKSRRPGIEDPDNSPDHDGASGPAPGLG